MRRVAVTPRPGWRERCEALGFDFHSLDGEPYWTEDAGYRFSLAQVDALEDATAELQRLCLAMVERVVQCGDYARLGLDDSAAALAEASWRRGERELYGRMDLVYDGAGPPRLLEYNADTPTALFEAAVVQWHWQQDLFPRADQFNSIHEKLIAAWKERAATLPQPVTFASVADAPEDYATAEYLRDTCVQGGCRTQHCDIGDIGWKGGAFVDLRDRPIASLFKLYPWEWLLAEPFGRHIARAATRWIEPAWKMLLSNKSALVLLWEQFPGHPNLLAASHDRADIAGDVVRKPRFGREGEGVKLLPAGTRLPFPGNDDVYQALQRLPEFDRRYPVVGSWVIAGVPAGIGIREDATPITRNSSRFVPHWFE
jgi:glutathionylspermidine synthase